MKTVLFVCIENSCRSQMAKGFFNTLTSSEHADSAGLRPADRVDPMAIEVMREVGIDISHYLPKKLTSEMNNSYDYIISMGCVKGCPLTPIEKTLEWAIEDPKGRSLLKYREVRDSIHQKVTAFIDEIATGTPMKKGNHQFEIKF